MTDEGKITDEAIARLRERIGVPYPHPAPPHYRRPGVDAFRHVAVAYGDENPLWSDADYARSTRWGTPIAPPPLLGGDSLIGEAEVAEVPAAQRTLMSGDPLRGVHAFYSASVREWWRPLLPDMRIFRRDALAAVLDKRSSFADRSVHEWRAQVFRDEAGTLLASQYGLMIRTERGRARDHGEARQARIAPYTEEILQEIDSQYAAERPRGAETRWWEDVAEGDQIGPMVKGPLTITDIVCWHVGMGMGLYRIAPLRLGYKNRKRIPRFFDRDGLNVPDVMQRVHWDTECARRSGNPAPFDYGRMRESWLIHLCTDWMGDESWLWKLTCEFRRFNYVGDTQWLLGVVTRRYLAAGGRPAVDLELTATNQHGEVTTPGSATILLPSREHGPVRLPDPPGNGGGLQDALQGAVSGFQPL